MTEIRNPGSYQVSSGLKALFYLFIAAGLGSFFLLVMKEPERAWSIFLVNHFYFMMLAIGGIFFASIQWLTGAMWSAPVRRISEALTGYFPFALVSTVILFFAIHNIYHWSHPEYVKGDIILEGKAGYLNETFFIIRNLIFFVVWFGFAKLMVGNSLKQDQDGSYHWTAKNRALSPIFLILFALSFTFASWDQLMSLEPHWFSTIFGVYTFAGMFYSTLALTCILTIYLKRKGALEGIVNVNHLHDLGKFMFAFTVFWAYIGFSQFMLIWYANLPEEVGYYILRSTPGWLPISIFLLVGKFMVPFFLLLPRDAKRSEGRLILVGWFMMIAQWIDVLWMVQPSFFKDGWRLGLFEIGVTLGFVGIFGLLVSRFLGKHNVVAIKDPRLHEAVFHHHQ